MAAKAKAKAKAQAKSKSKPTSSDVVQVDSDVERDPKLIAPKKTFDGSDEEKYPLFRRSIVLWRNRYHKQGQLQLGSYLLDALEGQAESRVMALIPDGEESYDQILKVLDSKYGGNTLTKATAALDEFRELKRGKTTLKDFLGKYEVARAKAMKHGWQPSERTDGADLLRVCELPTAAHAGVLQSLKNDKAITAGGLPEYTATKENLELLAETYALKDAREETSRKRPAMLATEPQPKWQRQASGQRGKPKGGGKGKGVCYDYLDGKCKRGGACKYSHAADGKGLKGGDHKGLKGGDPKGKGKGSDGKGRKSSAACRDFVKGQCKRGDACWFSHN